MIYTPQRIHSAASERKKIGELILETICNYINRCTNHTDIHISLNVHRAPISMYVAAIRRVVHNIYLNRMCSFVYGSKVKAYISFLLIA